MLGCGCKQETETEYQICSDCFEFRFTEADTKSTTEVKMCDGCCNVLLLNTDSVEDNWNFECTTCHRNFCDKCAARQLCWCDHDFCRECIISHNPDNCFNMYGFSTIAINIM